MGRKPGRDGARLRRDARAQAPSAMPRGYATAGARVGDALAAQLGRRQHRRAIDMPTTRRLSRTSNADMVAVACCKCIEDGVTTFITRIELLDRINLLINGAIGVRRATSQPIQTRKTRSVAKESLHHLPNTPGRRRQDCKCRAVLVLIFGKMLLVDPLDGYTKQRWQRNREYGLIWSPCVGGGKTIENRRLSTKLCWPASPTRNAER